MQRARNAILVVGVGNELLSDEGVGVHVARRLSALMKKLPPWVEVIDAGTALFDVLGELPLHSHVILVDAMRGGGEPGSIYRLDKGAELADRGEPGTPTSLHQWGVVETLRAARTLGLESRNLTVIGIEPETLEPSTDLSPAVAGAAERVVAMLLAELGAQLAATSPPPYREPATP